MVTLLIVALITTILVTYLQVIDSEKGSSLASGNRFRASLAADAGIGMAQAQLAALFQNYPDSAIGWAKLDNAVGTDDSGPETSVFYFRTTDIDGYKPAVGLQKTNAATPASNPSALFAWPLVSGASWVEVPSFTGANSVFSKTSTVDNLAGLTANNSININQENWVGTPLGNSPPSPTPSPPPIRARWVEVLNDPTKDKQPNSNAPQFNPAIARFAYYIEDESFKVNLNTVNATSTGRADDTPGESPYEGILQGILPASLSADINKIRDAFLAKPTPAPPAKPRANIPTVGTINVAASANATTAEDNKFILTTQSSALEQSRGGALRLNLNEVVQEVDLTDPESAQKIRLQLDRIIAAIDNQYAMPDFGERFFRTTSVTNNSTYLSKLNDKEVENSGLALRGVSLKEIYNQRIASNIRDIIDEDWIPTIVGGVIEDGTAPHSDPRSIRTTRPSFALGDPNADENTGNSLKDADFLAVGKEGLHITEFAMRALLKKMNPPVKRNNIDTPAEYEFALYFYIEITNPTNRDISISSLGPNPFIKIHSIFLWDVGGGDEPLSQFNEVPQHEYTFYFGSFKSTGGGLFTEAVIPANGRIVLCTEDADGVASTPFDEAIHSRFYFSEESALNFSGKTKKTSGKDNAVKAFWQANGYPDATQSVYSILSISGSSEGRSGTPLNYDCDLQILLGSDWGLIDSVSSVGLLADGRAFSITDNTAEMTNDGTPELAKSFLRSAAIWGHTNHSGESDNFTTGDPLSQNENLQILRYRGGGEIFQTRFSYVGSDNETPLGNGNFTLGGFNPASDPNPEDATKRWADYATNQLGTQFAPFSRYNGKLDSIGRLGETFDPVKVMENYDSGRIFRVRHGGRTLKIGQTEKYDATLNKFGLWDGNETSASRNWTAWRLADVFSNKFPTVDTNNDGKIDAKDNFPGFDRWQTEGVININGVSRDGGLALRTALKGFQFTENATGMAGKTLSDSDLNTIIQTVKDHLQNNAPLNPSNYRLFWERGQLSELLYREGADWKPFFSTGNKLGSNMAAVYDRAKEELFRRCVELICTKGNTFTVYSVGQTLNTLSGKVISTSRKKQTFRIMPNYIILDENGNPLNLPNDEDFDPASKNSKAEDTPEGTKDTPERRGKDRFRRPTSYFVVKLSEQNE